MDGPAAADKSLIRRDVLTLVKAALAEDFTLMRSVLSPYAGDSQKTGDLMEELVDTTATYLAESLATEVLLEEVPQLREAYEAARTAAKADRERVIAHLDRLIEGADGSEGMDA